MRRMEYGKLPLLSPPPPPPFVGLSTCKQKNTSGYNPPLNIGPLLFSLFP